MTLSPKLQDFLEGVNEASAQAKADGIKPTPKAARAALKGLEENYTEPKVKVKEVQDFTHHYTDDQGEKQQVPLRIYNPDLNKELNVLVLVHGGGHMCGDIDVYDYMARKLAHITNCLVVSVDYRLAPEHPYPAGVEDVYSVLNNIHAITKEYETTGFVYTVGDSGGGATLASCTQRAIKDKLSLVNKQVLIYPSLDYTLSMPSVEKYGKGYFLDKTRIEWYFDNYFAPQQDRKKASPLFGPFSDLMPETLVITAECDPLHDEGVEYVEQIKNHGFSAKHIEMPGMVHAYLFLETLASKECANTYRTVADFLT